MNFLAHAHLAYLTQTSITGNLLGDFIKGQALPKQWRQGIMLHRHIDGFTDSHQQVKKLKASMTEYRRYGGIAIDMLFDHHLANQFDQYCQLNFDAFCQFAYADIEQSLADSPKSFQLVGSRIIKQNWFASYKQSEDIQFALDRIGQRLKKPVNLGNAVNDELLQKSASAFSTFYPELIEFSKQQISGL